MFVVSAVAFAVLALQHEGKKSELMGMKGQAARGGVQKIGEDDAAGFIFALDGAVELATAEGLF